MKVLNNILKKVIEFNYMKTEFYRDAFQRTSWLFRKHAEWFNYKRKLIIIPAKFTKTHEERKVNLTPSFSEILYYYLEAGNELRYPAYRTWQTNLIRWSILSGIEDSINISAGTLRKLGKAGCWKAVMLKYGWWRRRGIPVQRHSNIITIMIGLQKSGSSSKKKRPVGYKDQYDF